MGVVTTIWHSPAQPPAAISLWMGSFPSFVVYLYLKVIKRHQWKLLWVHICTRGGDSPWPLHPPLPGTHHKPPFWTFSNTVPGFELILPLNIREAQEPEEVVGGQLDGLFWCYKKDINSRPTIHAKEALSAKRFSEAVEHACIHSLATWTDLRTIQAVRESQSKA